MKIKTYLIRVLALLALASCNTQRDSGGGATPEPYSYDDATSPLEGKLTFAISTGNYSFDGNSTVPVTFVVAEDGIYVKSKDIFTNKETWHSDPISLPLPKGAEEFKIFDATMITTDLVAITLELVNRGQLLILVLDSSAGTLSSVSGIPQNIPLKKTHFFPNRSGFEIPQDVLFTTEDPKGIPLLYRITNGQASLVTLATPTSQLVAGDQILGGLHDTDSGSNSFLVKRVNEAHGEPYQIWNINGTAPVMLAKELQNKEIVLTDLISSSGFVMAKNGASWKIDLSSGAVLGLVSQPFADNLNPLFFDKNRIATNQGFYELNGDQLTVPSNNDFHSYRTKKINTYRITGFYYLFDTSGSTLYITTSNGVWMQPFDSAWKGF